MPTGSTVLLPPFEVGTALRALLVNIDRKTSFRQVAESVPPTERTDIELIEHGGGKRAAVEAFISRHFAKSFGSRVEAFMPRLFSLSDAQGKIYGAFGLRSGNGKLFLEQYLDTPIERIIAGQVGEQVERRAIVEVGHFSGSFPGAVRVMISLLTECLYREGFEWVVFTGTTTMRNAFLRMGLTLIDIQAATIDRLPAEERAAWGSYYDYAPRVLAGSVGEGYRALRRHEAATRHESEQRR